MSFKSITERMNELYEKKNHDYGNSVHDTYKKFGLTSYLVRITDKLNRATTLNDKEALVDDESIKDTLMDMANYCVLAIQELENEEEK